MSLPAPIDKCLAFINCQMQTSTPQPGADTGPMYRAVTISRQTGAGGHRIGETVSALLQQRSPRDPRAWTVFDRNLVEKVLDDHHLSKNLTRFMTEDRTSELSDTLDEMFGLHPRSETLVRNTADTILRLVDIGRVVIIGRGAAAITESLPDVFHVRLVAPMEFRIRRIQESEELGRKAALDFINREDLGRRRFLKKYFETEIDDPLLYHLMINTGRITDEAATELIVDGMFEKPRDPS